MSGDPRVDAIWESLAPHIEWARGFSLILLFAHHPAPVDQIRARLEASLRERGRSLRVIEPSAYADASALTLAVLAQPSEDCGAIWIPLWWSDADASREFLLARLNERRFLLERDMARPLVLVLPSDFRAKIALAAPDLWVVRNFSEQLPSPEVELVSLGERGTEAHERASEQQLGRAEIEWRRLISAGEWRGLDIRDGLLAFESARERGRLGDARRIAMEVLMVVTRGRVEGDALTADVDELVAGADSLDPKSRGNLAMALRCLSDVEARMGKLALAGDLARRALELSEALAKADPDDAAILRQLVASYGELGDVEAQRGGLASALDRYRRALEVSEVLAKANPHNPEARRDLAVSNIKVADAEAKLGNLTRAGVLYRGALELSEAWAKSDPHDPVAQRDLATCYLRLGAVEATGGNLAAARDLYHRALEVNEALARSNPHSARAQTDLAATFRMLALVAEAAGQADESRDSLERAKAILDALDGKGQLQGDVHYESLRDLIHAAITKPRGPSA